MRVDSVPHGKTSAALETVRTFSDALLADDVAAAQAVLAPDVVIDEPLTLPYGGQRTGHDGFLAMLGEIGEQVEFEVLEREFYDAGAFVLAKMNTRWARRGAAESIETPYLELYTVTDGLITHVDIYPKDPGHIAGLWESAT